MGKIKNVYYNTKEKLADKIDRFFDGKDKEKTIFLISFFGSLLMLILAFTGLFFLGLYWQRHKLGWNMFLLYFYTFLMLLNIVIMGKGIKRRKATRKPKAPKEEVVEETESEEAQTEE